MAGQQFAYNFDDIGNRTIATINSQTGTYTANALNQYTQRTVPGSVWELGSATNTATVTINNQATARKADYFSKEFSVANSSSAVYTQLVTVGVLKNGGSNGLDIVSTSTGHVFTAKSPELFGYDSDGNTTNDGRWAYTWDGENRLIAMETSASVTSVLSSVRQKLLFGYDSQSRRISKVVSNFVGGSWVLTADSRFVYDGWNLVAELAAVSNQLSAVRTYAWGLDLSGSEQGAGGIGGLLFIGNHASAMGNYAVAYDGNGNVTALVDAGTGAESARFEYDPFGTTLRATGPAAAANPIRFSTKYTDDETGLLYYGYRYYQPSTGRWPSRDPLEEQGGMNLYGFVVNAPIASVDMLGLISWLADFSYDVTSHKYSVSGNGWSGSFDRNGGHIKMDRFYDVLEHFPVLAILGGFAAGAKGTLSVYPVSFDKSHCISQFTPVTPSATSFALILSPPPGWSVGVTTTHGDAGKIQSKLRFKIYAIVYRWEVEAKVESKVKWWSDELCTCFTFGGNIKVVAEAGVYPAGIAATILLPNVALDYLKAGKLGKPILAGLAAAY